jgi:bifunctional non-homologous end joining protein LigD
MRPMLAMLADAPMSDPNLVYEPKYDGIRALVTVTPRPAGAGGGADVRIASRVGNDKTVQFPEVVLALSRWGAASGKDALLDGELVALDADGQPTAFQRIQDRIHLSGHKEIVRRAAANPVAFVAFDLLRHGGHDIWALPLHERRQRLEAALAPALGDVVRLATQVRGDGSALLAEVQARGWEGLVVKDVRSPYRAGQRTREWRKLKLLKRHEFVIGGFTRPRVGRTAFGALLLGLPEPGGTLRYVGHVGSGFTERELERLQALLAEREIAVCPFSQRPVTNDVPHWTRPDLIAEVKFAGISDAGRLREPIYIGLREDLHLD